MSSQNKKLKDISKERFEEDEEMFFKIKEV
jgi:hypothetical protein